MLHALFAAFVTMLFCSCANDVDPALKAKKVKLERNIAALQKSIARSAAEVAAISARQLVGMDKPGEAQIKEDDQLEIGARTAQLAKDTVELIALNKEIDRQKMIAPNLLVDVMAEKNYDTVRQHDVFTRMPSTGNMTPTCVTTPTHPH